MTKIPMRKILCRKIYIMIILKYIVDLSINPKVSLSKPPRLNTQGAIQKRAEAGRFTG